MLLPIHPHPLEDELLSSWLTRLALDNGLYIHAFYKTTLGLESKIFTRDLDRLFIPKLISTLEAKTGIPTDIMKEHMLTYYEGLISEKVNVNGYSRWILPLGLYHRTRKRLGVSYCPKCLEEDPIKYFRMYWRLSFVTFCHKHHCLLMDECPSCHKPVDYQRLGVGNSYYESPINNLGICHGCGKCLWHTDSQPLPNEFLPYIGSYSAFLKLFIKRSMCLPMLQQTMPLQEFQGLWALITSLMKRHYFNKGIQSNIQNKLGIYIFDVKYSNNTFDDKPLLERFKILLVIFWILDQWPKRLLDLAKNTIFSQSAFSDNVDQTPFWLYRVIRSDLNKEIYSATDEELINIKHYLENNSIEPSSKNIATYAGMHLSTCREKLRLLKYKKA